MPTDPLRSAIERALPICPQCVERLDVTGATLCMECFHNSMARLNVLAAVAPLLAAERERREDAERDSARLEVDLDSARLDWLQAHGLASVSPDHDKLGVLCGWDVEWTDEAGREWLYTGLTIREAIDAAIAASDGEEKP
jgi:hypothetical protein